MASRWACARPMVDLYDYQRRAVKDVLLAWQGGARRVCLVMPTAAGKSVVSVEVVRRAREAGHRVLAVAHRRELVEQLCGHYGPEAAPVCAGMAGDASKPIQVASIQTLMARDVPIECGLVVTDECHHLPQGGQWVHVVQSYGDVRWLGLTATPERADGQPLGDTFDHLVVGAQYSELLERGRICPCDVFFPPETLQKGIALSVSEAYKRYANGGQAFVFVNSVDEAFKVTVELQNAGVLAVAVTGDSDSEERAESFMLFRRGYVKAIVNVFVCTEGIDVPSASVCILARGVGHASTYLQMVGRVLRTAPGKECARLIDLTGSVLAHGLPTSDREYSLTGTAIGVTKGGRSLRVCLQCGMTWESAGKPGCPRCGFVPTPRNKEPRIYDVELQAVYAGAETGSDAMAKELARLRGVARARGYSVGWVVKQYRDLFGCSPPGYVFAEDERRREWSRLVGITRDRGYKKGYAFARFKATFGSMPGWGW